jgi:hypothetical protein
MGIAAAIMIGIQAVGVGLSAAGKFRAGSAQGNLAELNARFIEETAEINARLLEEGAETNAEIAEYNARLAESRARDAIFRGRETETRFRTDIRGLIGAQRASYGAQGVDVSDGSSLEVQMDTAYQGELDALTIRTNAARESWGFRVEAENERMQATAIRKLGKLQAKSTRDIGRSQALSTRMGGQYAKTEGTLGAYTTIAAGSGNLLYQTYGFRRGP